MSNIYLATGSGGEVIASIDDYEDVLPPSAKKVRHSIEDHNVADTEFDYEVAVLHPAENIDPLLDDPNSISQGASIAVFLRNIQHTLQQMNNKLEEVNNRVETMDNTVNSKIDTLSERVHTIETLLGVNARQLTAIRQEFRNTQDHAEASNTYDLLPEFPLATAEMVETLENDCIANENVAAQFRHKVASIGGKDIQTCARRVMSSIFSNAATMNYTWFGLKNNICFQNYKIMQIIIETTSSTCNGTRHAAEAVVKKWLHHTKDRERKSKALN